MASRVTRSTTLGEALARPRECVRRPGVSRISFGRAAICSGNRTAWSVAGAVRCGRAGEGYRGGAPDRDWRIGRHPEAVGTAESAALGFGDSTQGNSHEGSRRGDQTGNDAVEARHDGVNPAQQRGGCSEQPVKWSVE